MKRANDSFEFRYLYTDVNSAGTVNHAIYPSLRVLRQDQPDSYSNLPLGSCLIDRSGRQFACIHKDCQNSSVCFKNEVLAKDPGFHALHFHPEDKDLFYGELYPDILKFMESIPPVDFKSYRFAFNHRFIRKDERNSEFLLEGTFSKSDITSLPVLNLNVFSEIGDIKTDENIFLTIFRYRSDLGYQKVFSREYRKKNSSLLSQRELEIIHYCLKGLSSKMIADKLNISIHTVKNHKRNCMEKTCTRNIAELIHLCFRNHWL